MNNLKYFLLYPSAPVQIKDWGVQKIAGYDARFKEPDLLINMSGGSRMINAKHCQLILKKLSSITEEHKREIARLLDWPDYGIQVTSYGLSITEYNWISKKTTTQAEISRLKLPFKVADYLRENSYDIDGLIEKGTAVEEITHAL